VRYANYSAYRADIDAVFARFTDPMPEGAFASLARQYPWFNERTIAHWYEHWLADKTWRPYRTNRTRSHRTFTDEQEDQLISKFETKYWKPKTRLSSRQFRAETQTFWGQSLDEGCRSTTFASSGRFRIAFLRRHNLSLRTGTLKKKEYPEIPEDIELYRASIARAKLEYGADFVVNMDETSWKDIQLAGKTIARKGLESVHIVVNGDPKAAMSVVCTISLSGNKLPPIYILRGETERAFEALSRVVSRSRITCSENGWMDEIIMLKYLSWLHAVFNEHPCALVMDSFPAHHTPGVRYKARSLGIEIIPVPRGLTGKYQPLDRRPFGALKRESQRLWDEMAAQVPGLQWNHVEAAKLLEEAWADLKRSTVVEGWNFDGLVDPNGRIDPAMDEPEAKDGDPQYTIQQFRATRDSESDDGEIDVEAVWEAEAARIQIAKKRHAKHRESEDQVLETDVPFHEQPTIDPDLAETARFEFRPNMKKNQWDYDIERGPSGKRERDCSERSHLVRLPVPGGGPVTNRGIRSTTMGSSFLSQCGMALDAAIFKVCLTPECLHSKNPGCALSNSTGLLPAKFRSKVTNLSRASCQS
jgi:DNA segregation ATPase FtsK/SpoIIIE-like protein